MTYIDTAVYDKPSVLIPRKGSLDKLYYVDTPFWNVDTIFYTDIDTSLVEPKYIYYYLEGQHLERLNKAGWCSKFNTSRVEQSAASCTSVGGTT